MIEFLNHHTLLEYLQMVKNLLVTTGPFLLFAEKNVKKLFLKMSQNLFALVFPNSQQMLILGTWSKQPEILGILKF